MPQNFAWPILGPELLTAGLGLGLLVLSLLLPRDQRQGLGYLAVIGLAGIFLSTFAWPKGPILNGMYLADDFAVFFKQLFLISALLVAVASLDTLRRLGYNQGEYYSLLVFATLGMMVMASAGELITLYMGLELMAISFCVLICFKMRDPKSSEAGIKYILLSAMSSAVLLYGMSLLYGLTGTTALSGIAAALKQGSTSPLLLVALIFVLAGFAFKISAVPFHMWAPDIYEGAPTPVTAFLAVASKAAGFAVLLRVFMSSLSASQPYWNAIIVVLTVMTVVLGNLVAIPQTNIKRLLAYSSISQAGYILMGLIAFSTLGVGAVLFHSLLYVFSNLGAFMVVIAFGNSTGSDEIKDYSGLSRRNPLLATVLLFCMLSLAGIPPMAGFVSKFYLFTAVIEKGYLWLALLSVLMSMVSVYYYLLVVKVMYLGAPPEGAKPVEVSSGMTIAMLASLAVLFFAGIYPAPLTEVAMRVAQVFFP